jgi:hypothetical protein
LAACSRSHGAAKPSAGESAEQIADDLELAFDRYYVCRELSPNDEAVWDGFSRECFTTLIAEHLQREDALSSCVRDRVAAYRSCGEETPCGELPCASATLLDDNPVQELIKEDCGHHLAAETRILLSPCR